MVTPILQSGSISRMNAIASTAVYEAVLKELGATGTIASLGDPAYRTAPTTNRSAAGVSGLETAVWTATEAPEAFDTAPTKQGICPVMALNGTDEGFITPDDTYWTRNDASNEGFSMGAWIKVSNSALSKVIMSKWDTNETVQEWTFLISSSEVLRLVLRDDSASVETRRDSDSAIPLDTWIQVVAVYDGDGGTAAADGITLYINGVVEASTATNNGSYTAMENGDSKVTIGAQLNTTPTLDSEFVGSIAGGPCGPFFTTAELTAAQAMNLYRIGRGALAL